MNVSIISKGVIINFIFNLILVFFLVHYQFQMSAELFTSLLIGTLFFVSAYCGAASIRFGQLNGTMIGLVSAIALFGFLAQFVSLNWVLNAWITCTWIVIGFVGGAAGNKLFKSKKAKE